MSKENKKKTKKSEQLNQTVKFLSSFSYFAVFDL